ncbi:MAG: Na/Pi cotransporter family protein [Balneolales bacterium]
MILLNIIGGVALILFGVRFLGKGLDRLFGHKLINWLHQMTSHRLKAFGAGIAISVVVPSSTTLALVALKLLHSTHLSFQRMLAVLLGTNIGITITVQLLAIRIYEYFPIFLILGLIAFQFLKRNIFRGIGQCSLALGFIFLAMNLISEAAASMSGNEEMILLIELLYGHPLALILISAVLTIMIQSSTAIVGIGLALADGGLGSLDLLIPIIIGSNIGIAGTALVAGYGSLEGRRLGTSNLLLKTAVGLLCLLALPAILEFMQQTPGDDIRQGANFHTLFNIIVAVTALPVLDYICSFTRFLISPDQGDGVALSKPPATYLNEDAIDSPALGLINATRETLLMADEVKNMLMNFWRAHEGDNPAMARQVQRYDDRIDTMNNEIKEYLSRMSEEEMSPQDTKLQFTLFHFISELEAIGDVIDKNLCHQLIKEIEQGLFLTGKEQQYLNELYRQVIDRFEMAISILASRDAELAAKMLAEKEQLNEWCRAVQKDHYENLDIQDVVSLESSSYFIDTMNSLRRISSHLTSIAYSFAR